MLFEFETSHLAVCTFRYRIIMNEIDSIWAAKEAVFLVHNFNILVSKFASNAEKR